MDFTKRTKEVLIFLYLVLFPFGQLARVPMSWAGLPGLRIYLTDIVVLILFFLYFFEKRRFQLPANSTAFVPFLAVSIFSYVFSLPFVPGQNLGLGFLYLLRFSSYIFLIAVIWDFTRAKKKAGLLINSLVLLGSVVALFGWIQYFLFPDLRPFFRLGWDEHLWRIFGSFLDPNFTSIILVLTLLLLFWKMSQKRSFLNYLTFGLVFSSFLFTYSRSGYLAFVAGTLVFFALAKSFRKMNFVLVLFFVSLLLIPKNLSSEGVKLERTASVTARFENWKRTFEIASFSPLFGVGFNNLGFYNVYKFNADPASHSVSGSDSSLLFVFATTGVVGLISYLSGWLKILRVGLRKKASGRILVSVVVALFVHSLFVNSLFYPAVLGWIAIFLGSIVDA